MSCMSALEKNPTEIIYDENMNIGSTAGIKMDRLYANDICIIENMHRMFLQPVAILNLIAV